MRYYAGETLFLNGLILRDTYTLTQNDPSHNELQRQKNALIIKIAERKTQFEKKEKLYNVLKPIAVYGTLIVPLLSLAAGLLTLTLLFAPFLLPLTVLILTGLVGLTYWFSNDIKYRIEDKFSLYDEKMAIQQDEANIELDMKFVAKFSLIEKDLGPCVEDYRAFIEAIEVDLQDIATLEASKPLNKNPEAPSTVSNHSLFKPTKINENSDSDAIEPLKLSVIK